MAYFGPIMAIFPNLQAETFPERTHAAPYSDVESCGKNYWDRSFEKNRKGQKITYFWPILDHFN